MSELCTKEEIIKFIGAVAYHVAAPGVARAALVAGAKAAGWEGVEDAINHAAPPAPPANKAGKAKKGDNDTDGGKADKKPRKMTYMNLFTNILLDIISKDPHNQAYKMPTTVDAEGKTVPARGGHMTFVGACWKALSDEDKTRFNEIVQPLLDTVNEGIASHGKRPENLHTEVQAHLSKTNTERVMIDLVNKSVLAHTGINPGKAGASTQATPAGGKLSAVKSDLHNGDTTDKKRKKKAADEKDSKKSKHDKSKDKKKKKDDKKASSSSSSSSSDSDSD